MSKLPCQLEIDWIFSGIILSSKMITENVKAKNTK